MFDTILQKLSGKRVVVTGASGYIGSHLCKRLVELGCEVHAISRNYTSHLDNGNVIFERINLMKLNKVWKYFRKVNPEFIFHLAGHVSGDISIEMVPSTLQSNLVTTVNMLTIVAEQKNSRLILLGSLDEPDCSQHCTIPPSPYAISKWSSTNYAKMFHKLYNTPLVIVRLFMVYGPGRQDSNKLIPYVIQNLLNNKSPQLSSGKREIDWIYIDDVIEGLIRVAITKNIEGQTIDLGSGTTISTRKMVEKIKKLMDGDTPLEFGALEDRPEEMVRKANISETHQKIQWKPVTDQDKGLRNTIKWYRKQQSPVTQYTVVKDSPDLS
jgi:nucleoside-diphosphate-sugar epimerase